MTALSHQRASPESHISGRVPRAALMWLWRAVGSTARTMYKVLEEQFEVLVAHARHLKATPNGSQIFSNTGLCEGVSCRPELGGGCMTSPSDPACHFAGQSYGRLAPDRC